MRTDSLPLGPLIKWKSQPLKPLPVESSSAYGECKRFLGIDMSECSENDDWTCMCYLVGVREICTTKIRTRNDHTSDIEQERFFVSRKFDVLSVANNVGWRRSGFNQGPYFD